MEPFDACRQRCLSKDRDKLIDLVYLLHVVMIPNQFVGVIYEFNSNIIELLKIKILFLIIIDSLKIYQDT